MNKRPLLIKRHLANLLYPVDKTLMHRRGPQTQSGASTPLCRLHFEGTLNRYVVEEKFYCVLPNHQMWSKDPNRRKMSFVFLKGHRLFRTFNHRLAFGIDK